jgi:hypothetical protein
VKTFIFLLLGLVARRQAVSAPGNPAPSNSYSADWITEEIQPLFFGLHYNRVISRRRIFRDSEGRTRLEEKPPGMLRAAVSIVDPITRIRYVLNTEGQTAVKYPMRPGDEQPGTYAFGILVAGDSLARSIAATPLQSSRQDLGSRSILGFSAMGVRDTITIPAHLVGNDSPINIVTDTWFSTEHRFVVLQETSDPRSRNAVRRAKNVRLTQPDPSLFQVPANYAVVEAAPPVPRKP